MTRKVLSKISELTQINFTDKYIFLNLTELDYRKFYSIFLEHANKISSIVDEYFKDKKFENVSAIKISSDVYSVKFKLMYSDIVISEYVIKLKEIETVPTVRKIDMTVPDSRNFIFRKDNKTFKCHASKHSIEQFVKRYCYLNDCNLKEQEIIPTMKEIFNKCEQYRNSHTRYRDSNNKNDDVIYLRYNHNGQIGRYNFVLNPKTFVIVTFEIGGTLRYLNKARL